MATCRISTHARVFTVDTTPPAAVGGVWVTALAQGALRVRWQAPSEASSGALRDRVVRSLVPAGPPDSATQVMSPNDRLVQSEPVIDK